MSRLVLAGLAPHPPIIVPEVGRGSLSEAAATVRAMKDWAQRVRKAGPEVLVMITPHGLAFQDAIAVLVADPLEGDFGRFGAGGVEMSWANDPELARAIVRGGEAAGVRTVALDRDDAGEYGLAATLDHGLLVPLYYLRQAGLNARVVPVGIGMYPYIELYAFGRAIRRAIEDLGRRAAVIASGDLSHRLTPSAPAGYEPDGATFDGALVAALRERNVRALLGLDAGLIERAGECGLRPIWIMLGSLDGLAVRPEVLSYEGPFGVGYAVALFEPTGDAVPGLLEELRAERQEAAAKRREGEDEFVRLARRSLEAYAREGKTIHPPDHLPEGMDGRAGVFVSLKKDGMLRGCIGTIAPTRRNIAEEIIHNAISAGANDPRFDPVRPEELDDLTVSVDVLTAPEPVAGPRELDPARYGVIVRKGGRSGLLLPNLEGVDTVEEQLAIARRKAGIGPHETGVELLRFEVIRHH